MRYFLLFPFLFLLCSCSFKTNEIIVEDPPDSAKLNEQNYPLDRFINWDDILSFEGDYFVYVFSYRCFYCNQIKDLILTYYELSFFEFYFVEFVEEIPIDREIEKTIGVKDIDEVCIKGVPTLLEVKNKEIVGNYAGPKEIGDVITNS